MNNVEKFQISIDENIKLALDSSLDSLKAIYKDTYSVKHYKSAIINLHNSLELTFKFMLLQRNEFMVFTMGGNNFSKILNMYKKAKFEGENSVIDYLENNPAEGQLHTVSFKDAYEILAYIYKCEHFDERFLFQLEFLEALRNKLTHFQATIKRIDFIILNNLFFECIKLFNEEVEYYNKNTNNIHEIMHKARTGEDKYTQYTNHYRVQDNFFSINKEILLDILEVPKYKLILSTIIRLGSELLDTSFNCYEKIINMCYEENKEQFKVVYEMKDERKIKSHISQDIYMLKASNLIEEGDVIHMEVAIMSEIRLSHLAQEIILRKCEGINVKCEDMIVLKRWAERLRDRENREEYY